MKGLKALGNQLESTLDSKTLEGYLLDSTITLEGNKKTIYKKVAMA